MAASLGEDTDALSVGEGGVDVAVHVSLVDVLQDVVVQPDPLRLAQRRSLPELLDQGPFAVGEHLNAVGLGTLPRSDLVPWLETQEGRAIASDGKSAQKDSSDSYERSWRWVGDKLSYPCGRSLEV